MKLNNYDRAKFIFYANVKAYNKLPKKERRKDLIYLTLAYTLVICLSLVVSQL